MTEIQGFADAHLHIVDVKKQGGYPDIDCASLLLTCTSSFDQWDEQRQIDINDIRTFPFYGIHPWSISTAPADYDDRLQELLKKEKRAGVGEIGIDKTHPQLETQMRYFERQIEIAKELKRPVTIHMVGTEAETLKALKEHSIGAPVILHSYSGPDNYVNAFSDEDCYFSISPRILQKSEIKIMRILSTIPDDRLLVETDAPIRNHHCNSMGQLISILAGFKSMTVSEFITLTRSNTLRVIG